MSHTLKTVFGKARQSKNKWLSVMLSICMVFSLCPMMSLTAFAAVPCDNTYGMHVYDSLQSSAEVTPQPYLYGQSGTPEDFKRTFYFQNGIPQSSGYAVVATVSRYEGDTIYIDVGIKGQPKDNLYTLAYNYKGGSTPQETLPLQGATSGRTAFKIPYNYEDLTIAALDGATMHSANAVNGGAFITVLDIKILKRSTTIGGQVLENYVNAIAGASYPYTGTSYTPFSGISQYVTVTGGTDFATQVGTYNVTLQPTDGYKWSDLSGEAAYNPRNFSWSIIPSTPSAPATPSVTKTHNSIVINNPASNQVYSIDGTKWYTAEQLASNPFVNMEEGKEYTISTKIPATSTSNESPVTTIKVTTDVTISGKISGEAVALPAEVTLTGAGGTYKVTTDANGNYSRVVPVGSYTVTAAGKDGLQAGTGNFSASAANKTVPKITMKDTDKGTAKKFVDQYLTGQNGNIYTAATDANYNQILSGQEDWGKLTADEKEMVDEQIGASYNGMLDKADELKWDAKIGDIKYEHLAEALAEAKSGNTVEMLRNPKEDTTSSLVKGAAVKNGDAIYTAKADGTKVSVDPNGNIALNRGSLNCKDTNGTPVTVTMPDSDPLAVSSEEEAFDVTVPETGDPYVTFPATGQDIEIDGVKFQSDTANGKMYLPNPLAAEDETSGKITAQIPAGESVTTKGGRTVTALDENTGVLKVTNEGVTVENTDDVVTIDGKEYTAKSENTVIAYNNGNPTLSGGSVELDKNETILVGKISITNAGDASVTVTADDPAKILIPAGGKVVIDGVEYSNDGDTALELPVNTNALDFIKTYLSGEDGKVYNEVNAENYAQIVSGKEVFDSLDQAAKDADAMLATDDADAYNAYKEYLAVAAEIQNKVDDFVSKYLSDKDGNIYTGVSDDNFAQILSGETAWDDLSDIEKEAVNAKLQASEPGNYPDLIAAAKKQKTTVEDAAGEFVEKYLTGENGDIFKGVTEENYKQILSGKDAWDALSDGKKEAVNARLQAAGANPDNYPDMLKAAADQMAAIDSMVDQFIGDYLTGKDGEVYAEATDGNYAQILSGKADWDKMSDIEKAAVNAKLAPTTYEELLTQAESVKITNDNADKFIADYLTGKDGKIYTKAAKDNYAQILSGKADWDKMSDAEKAAVNAKLAPTTYEELLTQAESVKTTNVNADKFIADYLTGKDGKIYTKAAKDNYEQLLSGKAAWDAMSDAEKAAVNAKLAPTTYEELLADAKSVADAIKNPGTGDNSNMLLWVALLFVSGAGVFGTAVSTKKKKTAK